MIAAKEVGVDCFKIHPGCAGHDRSIGSGGIEALCVVIHELGAGFLVIEEIKDAEAITSYTRWVDAVVRGAENPEVFLTFNPRFERI